ncbi:hypothetical protein CENSYa_1921 [Cenarchaeum symbiosum A]|uniref:Uncharacterized protein n=1 Tax=Cenarchaeum symbiosum (strain A) TaxID=414004 RepID=A0RYW3_CENSY|nr:hypothetical protein CENSYa_1921 [Cenarchaeum symbiosum A]
MSEIREYLDFEVIKERWNVYDLEDGTKIKTRMMLYNVWLGTDNSGSKKYLCDIRKAEVLLCDPSMQGEKDQTDYTPEQLGQSIEKDACQYTTTSYEPSEYTFGDNARMFIHSNMGRISRTSIFDSGGNRIYSYDLASSPSICQDRLQG